MVRATYSRYVVVSYGISICSSNAGVYGYYVQTTDLVTIFGGYISICNGLYIIHCSRRNYAMVTIYFDVELVIAMIYIGNYINCYGGHIERAWSMYFLRILRILSYMFATSIGVGLNVTYSYCYGYTIYWVVYYYDAVVWSGIDARGGLYEIIFVDTTHSQGNFAGLYFAYSWTIVYIFGSFKLPCRGAIQGCRVRYIANFVYCVYYLEDVLSGYAYYIDVTVFGTYERVGVGVQYYYNCFGYSGYGLGHFTFTYDV